MIYFDNAASTWHKPRAVIEAVNRALIEFPANPGRSGHAAALRAAQEVAKARDAVAARFNPGLGNNVAFTHNCTDALNLAVNGLPGRGHVITTANEHNSVLRPLFEGSRAGKFNITILPPDSALGITAEAVRKNLLRDTVLVAVNHISNVTGAVSDIAGIGRAVSGTNALFLVDAAQSGGHVDIDMQRMHIDLLALAPHKGFHAIQGLGALLFSPRCNLRPVRFGGTGTESENVFQPADPPEAFESGTVATPAIAAFRAGLDYTADGADREETMRGLTRHILEGLEKIDGVTVYSPDDSAGIASFNIGGMSSSEAADILDARYDICVRPGLHCAPLIHRHLGTLETGMVRVSLSWENTFEEAKLFLQAVREISAKSHK
ncbi:MAG: aminotransferase class V-fold PLP-dependent enzyme [Firmicutes bacterium]|nr:aminotransferase class V-fold PLP-dependent enzyme [Bacillota bacterium]